MFRKLALRPKFSRNVGLPSGLTSVGRIDADVLLAWLKERDIAAVIPPKANRREQRMCDWHQYKERHVIECMFGKLKYFRRIATRFEKKASALQGNAGFCCCTVMASVMSTEPRSVRGRNLMSSDRAG